MTSTGSSRGTTRPTGRDSPTHLSTVGQTVRLKDGVNRPALVSEIYHITGVLPPSGDLPQYRIRSDDERRERVTTQNSLEPVSMSPSDDGENLIERTFGHGQGTETKQSRDQKAEANKGTAKT